MERFKDTSRPVFKSICALSRGILTKKNGRDHTLPCGCFEHRALNPNHSFCKSAQYQASFYTQRTIPTTKKKWEIIPVKSSYGGALSAAVFKMVTRMVRHHDQDEGPLDASLHWDAIRQVLLKAIAKHGERDFSDEQWLRLVHEGSSRTRFDYCEDSTKSLACFRAIQGHSGGIPIDPELMVYIRIPDNWKGFFFHRGRSFSIQSILENGLILGGNEK